jgi:hypothetical protein
MFTLAVQAGKLLHRPHIPMLQKDNVRTGLFKAELIGWRSAPPAFRFEIGTAGTLTLRRALNGPDAHWKDL